MPELRKDPMTGRWVIIATERARRPGNFVVNTESEVGKEDDCPYCGFEGPFVYSALRNGNGSKPWEVCVVNFSQSFLNADQRYRRESNGLYDVINGYGAHEVVVETPEHISNMADLPVEQIQLVVETYARRIVGLEQNRHFQYMIAYKNYGEWAGSRNLRHSRSHIIATAVRPIRVKEKLHGAKEYFLSHKSCVYCDIIKKELAERKRIIAETDEFVALIPFAARYLFEVWILPKHHDCDFARGVTGRENSLAKIMKTVLMKFKLGLDDPAYNYIVHSAPFYRGQSGQNKFYTIENDYHWHIELTPRMTMMAGFEKGTGFFINSVPPEDMAQFLSEVEVP